MALPDLRAILTASTEGFDAALKRARAALDDLNDGSNRAGAGLDLLKGAFAGLAGAVTAGAFVNLIKGAIDSADHLNDLSKKTGVAVETLGGFGFAAEQAGSNVDAVSLGLGKLNLSLAAASAGNAKAKEAFDVLGISVKNADGTTKSAATAFAQIADKFASYNDGPEKAALGNRIFGKSYQELLPLLDDGGGKLLENVEYYKRYSGVTQELAEKSDEFNDTLTKLSLLSGAFGKQVASELLPGLQALAETLVDTKEKGTALADAAGLIGTAFDALLIGVAEVTTELYKSGVEFKAFGDKIDSFFGRAREPRTISQISDAVAADTAAADQKLADFRARLDAGRSKSTNPFAKIDFGTSDAKADAPGLAAGGKAGKVDDVQKKLLDQQLKELDQYISAEKDALAGRNDALQLFYQRDEVSVFDYYAVRKTYRDDELGNVQAAYAKEIAALEAYIAKTGAVKDGKSEGKVIEAQTKLIDVRGKLAKVESDAANKNLKDWDAQDKAVEKYHDRLDGLAATIASFSGDTAAAFESNFAAQNKSLKAQLAAVLDSNNSSQDERNKATQGIIDLDQIKQQGIATAQLNDLSTKRSVILGDLANQQARIDLSISLGNKTELQGLADISAANAARLASLAKISEAYDKIAETSSDPRDRVAADALHVEMEKLAAQTDLVADKFNAIGESAIENLVNKLGTGTVKAKDLLKGFFSDISSSLLKMQSKDVGNQLFGKDGLLSGIGRSASSLFPGDATAGAAGSAGTAASSASSGVGGFLASLFGGTGGATGASGAAAGTSAALTSLTAAASPLTPVFAALSAAAQAAATSLGSVSLGGAASGGGSNGSGLLGSLVAKFGGSNLPKTDAADFALLDSRSAKGNVFLGGNVIPFARGGSMVNRPTMFPMAGGRTGLMGEAGPEAIVPLKRGANGVLGLAGAGGGDNLTVHQTFVLDQPTPRQNQGQLVNAAAKALDRRRRTRSA